MVFLFPALLNILAVLEKCIKLVLVLNIYLFFIFEEPIARAWLAVLMKYLAGVLWAILNRQWKLIEVGAIY